LNVYIYGRLLRVSRTSSKSVIHLLRVVGLVELSLRMFLIIFLAFSTFLK
jgi:hypothetical protein